MKDMVEPMSESPRTVGFFLCVTAVLLVLAERLGQRTRERADLRVSDALLIGFVQGLAVLPGVSRSGATISVALWRDARPDVAVGFSLLVSIPAIVGANLLVLLEGAGELGVSDLAPFGVGFAAAFGSGYLSLHALQWVVARRRLLPFAGYCGALGVGAIAFG